MPKVSDTISAPSGVLGDPVWRGIAAIEAVHSVDSLPTITFERLPLPVGHQGYYDPKAPYRLIVAIGARVPEFTTVHELGHVVDHHGFGGGTSLASGTDPRFVPWRRSLIGSNAVAALTRIVMAAGRRGGTWDRDLADQAAYLLTYPELWARSYQQYIAVQSGDPILKATMIAARTRPLNRLYMPYFWDDADFDPIADAIDDLFTQRGWRP